MQEKQDPPRNHAFDVYEPKTNMPSDRFSSSEYPSSIERHIFQEQTIQVSLQEVDDLFGTEANEISSFALLPRLSKRLFPKPTSQWPAYDSPICRI